MSDSGLVFAPRAGSTLEISTGRKKKKSKWSPKLVWIITAVIIALIIILGLVVIFTFQQEVLEVEVGTDVVNLDLLIDAENALCCLEPASINPTERWLYESSSNYTISLDQTDCSNVCTGLIGSNLTQCETFCQGPDGLPKPVAHKGIAVYYAFAPGNVVNVCQSFVPCP